MVPGFGGVRGDVANAEEGRAGEGEVGEEEGAGVEDGVEEGCQEEGWGGIPGGD